MLRGGGEPPSAFFSKLKLWLLAFLTALLAGLPGAAAQITGQRMDLHQLIAAEQQALADLIHAWLDENPDIITQHKDCFEEGIHSTNNFLPWHRVHIQELEDYIREHANAADFTVSIPNVKDESFRLPKWQPEIAPASGDKIPTAFQVTSDPVLYPVNTQQDTMKFNPDPSQFSDMNMFLTKLSNCTTQSDAGAFSNQMEANYHDHGHTIVGGRFNQGDAPACLIFWPWHAWVDDLWYDWENRCQGEYDWPFNTVNNFVNQTVSIISVGTLWTDTMYVKGEVRILNGATLTIQRTFSDEAVIHFRESGYNGFPTRIVVEPGGRLVVDGATLTGIDEFGDCGDGDDPNNGCQGTGDGSIYYSAWEGIVVQASGNNFGVVELTNNARIEHAIKGISTEGGGRISATGALFYNNRRDVEIGPYGGVQQATFTGCDFINDQPLRDIVWEGGPLNTANNCAGGTPEHHINHFQTHSSEAHVLIRGARGGDAEGIKFSGCVFDNTFQDPHGNYVSLGIEGRDAQFTVEQCTIRNQVIGISAANKTAGPGKNVTVRQSTFDNNFEGIRLWGVDNSVIEATNIFKVPDEIPTGVAPADMLSNIGAPFGVYSLGSSGLTVADNQFSTVGAAVSEKNYGVILDYTSSSFAASTEKRNTFTGIGIASQTQGINANLQIRCNNYNDFRYGIAVTSGTLMDQGECIFNDETAPANNTWDNPGCVGDESQIYKDASATSFDYRAHTNQLPTCYSSGVTPVDCQTSSTSLSCINGEPPPCEGCELQRIADLEADKNVLPSGDERRQFITHEQQSIYQQGVNERMENEGVDDAIEFTEDVEAITALWPGNKAALLLLKSEQEDAIASGTVAAIAAVAATDPNKKWLELRYDLLTSGRTYSQITATEKAMVEAEAEQQTKSGAHAKAILEDVYGVQIQPYIELIGGERSSKPVAVTTTTSNWSIAPNPAQHNVVVLFTAPETAHQSSLEITDVNGRTLRQFDLSHHFGDSQQAIPVDGFSPGIYLVRLSLNGIVVGVEKMAVIR